MRINNFRGELTENISAKKEALLHTQWNKLCSRWYSASLLQAVLENAVLKFTGHTLSVPLTHCRYTVDYSQAGYNKWGHLAGCSFARDPPAIVKASTVPAIKRHYCQITPGTDRFRNRCNNNYQAFGPCNQDMYPTLQGLNIIGVRPSLNVFSKLN